VVNLFLDTATTAVLDMCESAVSGTIYLYISIPLIY
jgi:hypothetical protein